MARKKQEIDRANIAIIDEPPVWKWLLGLSSAGVLGAGLYFFDVFGTSLYYLSLHQQLQHALVEEDTALPEVLDNPDFTPLLASRESQLKALRGVDGFLQIKEFGRAIAASNHPALARLDGKEAVRSAIENIRTVQAEELAAQQSIEEERQKLVGLKSQYAIQASRLARLFELNDLADRWQEIASEVAQENEEGGVGVVTRFYKVGVLAGLPMLEGIPDGVSDLRDLGGLLQTANARRITYRLGRKNSKEQKTLASVEADSMQLASMIEESNASILLAKDAHQKLVTKVSEAEQKAQQSTALLVAQLAQPALTPKAKMVYAFVKEHSKGHLGKLPALPQEATKPAAS